MLQEKKVNTGKGLRVWLVVILMLVSNSLVALAPSWSYVYIQGDKNIPFYVRLEGEMMPRYSKNYCIIPQLEAGPIHLQILFQQNEFPPLDFTVLIPDNGYRQFLLVHKDQSFALYDLQQQFYLFPGANSEDHLPEMITYHPEQKPTTPNAPATNRDTETTAAASTSEPQFIEDLVLTHQTKSPQSEPQTVLQSEPTWQQDEQHKPPKESEYNIANEPALDEMPDSATEEEPEPPNLSTSQAPIINSDCPEPLNQVDFDRIYHQSKEKKDDEKRVWFLMKKAEDNCFTTQQSYFLARDLTPESMRYSFLKKIFPHITDQQNFYLLEEPLFKTLEWKSYFRLIYQEP